MLTRLHLLDIRALFMIIINVYKVLSHLCAWCPFTCLPLGCIQPDFCIFIIIPLLTIAFNIIVPAWETFHYNSVPHNLQDWLLLLLKDDKNWLMCLTLLLIIYYYDYYNYYYYYIIIIITFLFCYIELLQVQSKYFVLLSPKIKMCCDGFPRGCSVWCSTIIWFLLTYLSRVWKLSLLTNNNLFLMLNCSWWKCIKIIKKKTIFTNIKNNPCKYAISYSLCHWVCLD